MSAHDSAPLSLAPLGLRFWLHGRVEYDGDARAIVGLLHGTRVNTWPGLRRFIRSLGPTTYRDAMPKADRLLGRWKLETLPATRQRPSAVVIDFAAWRARRNQL